VAFLVHMMLAATLFGGHIAGVWLGILAAPVYAYLTGRAALRYLGICMISIAHRPKASDLD